MNGRSSDRNLLLGILALQMDFIPRDALIRAMHRWTLDKRRSLSEILVELAALDPSDRLALEDLVERHIARHGGDPEKSLSSLDLKIPSDSTLSSIEDPDILRSLSRLGVTLTRGDGTTKSEMRTSRRARGTDAEGRFQIVSLHDEGGLGCVYLARDVEVNREVALKRLKEEIASDDQSRARFVFEAEITGNLEHPGIVPIYGKGEYADGRPYYAMRFVRGDNLKVAVDRFHKDPHLRSDPGAHQRELQKLLRRFLAVCETMSYVHSRGVIHRDLKPRNILLGPYGETLIVDWGLAKVVGHTESIEHSDATLRPPSSSDIQPTSAGSRVGTPAYMSPEQARGEVDQLGPAADIYSLGATLYYMLTYQAPFTEQNVPEMLSKVERGEFRRPREIKPGISRALEAVCNKAMALRPQDRYGSALALAADIEHWLADQPVSAYFEPISTRVLRWLRRRKQLVAAAALLCLLGLGLLLYHDRRITTEQAATSAQLEITRKALRDLFDLAGSSLAYIANTEDLREGLAKHVLDLYQELSERFRNDPGVRLEIAQVHRVIGGIRRITGQFDGSRQAYNQSIELLEKLSNEGPEHSEYWHWLAEGLVDRGELFHMNGETDLSEHDFQTAILHSEKIPAVPISSSYRRVRASALINLSEVLVLKDKLDDALRASDQAVSLLKPLADTDQPTGLTSHDQWLLSMALTDRGTASLEIGEPAAAAQDLDAAEAVANRIPEQDDESYNAKFQLACICNRRGEVLGLEPSAFANAEQQYDRAAQLLDDLIRSRRLIPHYREEMAVTLAGRARVRAGFGPSRMADAHTDCGAAQTHLEALIEEQKRKGSRINPHYLSLLSRTLTTTSRIDVALGNSEKGKAALMKATDLMKQAINLDPARVRNRAFLDATHTQSLNVLDRPK